MPSQDPQSEYWQSLGTSLVADSEAVSAILRGRHYPTEGALREGIIRQFLGRFLPDRYAVSTGFIQFPDGPSSQLDILIWDRLSHSPLFQAGDLVVVAPDACVAAGEVKTRLDRRQLADALRTLEAPYWRNYTNLPNRVPVRFVVAFHSTWRKPETMLHHIANHYRDSLGQFAHRLCLRLRSPHQRVTMPGAPQSRLGDFEWPRFPALLDLLLVLNAGWTVSQRAVFNDHPRLPGHDAALKLIRHDSPGAAAAYMAAMLAEVLGRSDERTAAYFQRAQFEKAGTTFLLGTPPRGLRAQDAWVPVAAPLFDRPFDHIQHFPGADDFLTLGSPRTARRVLCSARSTCNAVVDTESQARTGQWLRLELPQADGGYRTCWLCPNHHAGGVVSPEVLSELMVGAFHRR